jgi:hypothetical protein
MRGGDDNAKIEISRNKGLGEMTLTSSGNYDESRNKDAS